MHQYHVMGGLTDDEMKIGVGSCFDHSIPLAVGDDHALVGSLQYEYVSVGAPLCGIVSGHRINPVTQLEDIFVDIR